MMSEFNKIKIAFALALLGTLYTLNPIVLKYGDISFSFLGYGLKVQMVYFSFLTLLGISVYFYAIALISENKIFIFMQKGGNISYTISLLIPPLYISLYVISIIVEIVSNYANFPTVALLFERGMFIAVVLFASFVAYRIINHFASKDRSEKIEELSKKENTLLNLAKKLYEQEFFDLSVLEAWKAIETSINKALFYQGLYSEKITGFKLIDYAKSKKLFKNSQLKEILDIWRFRNKVSHTEEQVSAQKTEEILAIADHLIASLEAIRNQCYYCNKLKKTTEMHCDNITGAYICKNCLKDHPNWKEELMDMGMDP